MALDKIGKYQIRRELGRGGMAAVYEAYDPTFERIVALKVLPDELLHDTTFRARFEREAKTIAGLEHPAIVPVYDFGEADGKVFLAMRYMGGGSLADKLRVGRLSPADIAKVYDRLAPALDRAHGKGVTHRDLKPGNILFDDNHEPYVSDFGIAKLSLSTNTELTQGGAIGTPSYMSPEQARGERLDGRSDVYAMGVMLFELLSGGLPFVSETPTGMMMKHILDPIPRLAALAPGLPGAWQVVVDRAMAKNPNDRYANMASLSNDINSIVEGRSINATPPMVSPLPMAGPGAPMTQVLGTAQPMSPGGGPTVVRPGTPPRPISPQNSGQAPPVAPPRPEKRRASPLLIVGVLIGACALVGAGATAIAALSGAFGPGRPLAPAGTATPPVIVVAPTSAPATPVPATALPATAIPATAVRTAVPTATARPATLDASTVNSLRELRVMADSTDTVVRSVGFGTEGVVVFASLGNVSNQAAPENRFQYWRRADGSVLGRVTVASIPWSADLSPDSRGFVVAAGKNATLYRTADGTVGRVFATVGLEMNQVAYSSDGKLVATGGVDVIGKTPIQVFAADTGARVFQVDNGYNMGGLRFSPDSSLLAGSNSLGQVTVWRIADGKRMLSYKFDSNGVTVPVAFSPDGKYFAAAACAKACAAADQTSDVRVWKADDWSAATAFKEAANPVEALGFPPGGDLLFVGGRNRSKFFKLPEMIATPGAAATRQLTLAGVTSVDFSADGSLAVFGTSSGGVRLWGMP